MTIATKFPGDTGPRAKARRNDGDALSTVLQRTWTIYGVLLAGVLVLGGVFAIATSQEYDASPMQAFWGVLAVLLSPLAAVGPLTVACVLQRLDGQVKALRDLRG